MAWTQNSDGSLTHAGTTRDAWVLDVAAGANATMKVQLSAPAGNVRVMFFASHDGRSGWEAGIEGPDVVVLRTDFGVENPLAAWTPHLQAAGIPFLMEVRKRDAQVEMYLNGAETPTLTYATTGQYAQFDRVAIVSDTDGAVVLRYELCELAPAIETSSRVLVVVCGGDVWKAVGGGETITQMEPRVFREEGHVSLCEFRNVIYGVDGQRGRVLNVVTNAVTLWEPPEGTLPGRTVAGSTTLRLILSHGGRIWGVPADDNRNLHACRLNDADDWDTASLTAGRAFTTPIARASQSGQVVRSLATGSQNHLLVGGAASIWRLMGDPVRGAVLFEPASATIGVCGPNAMFLGDEGYIVFMAPAGGLYLLPAGGAPVPLSSPVLTEGITVTPEELDSLSVTVVRDTVRLLVHIFITRAGGAGSLHFVYDEREGQYQRGAPALYPIEYPDRISPTCAVTFEGRVLLGGQDGYVYELDDEADDDDGEDIESWVTLSRAYQPVVESDVLVRRVFPRLGADSDPVTVRTWKGQSPEEAYDDSARRLGWSRAGVTPLSGPITQPVRAPMVLVEVHADEGRFVVEAFEAESQLAALSARTGWAAAVAAGEVCRQVRPGTGSSGGSAGSVIASGPGWGQSYGGISGGSGHSTPSSGGGSAYVGSWTPSTAGMPADKEAGTV